MYLIPLYALLNCLRGRGLIPGGRIIFSVLMGVLAGWYSGSLYVMCVCVLGITFWAVPAWGGYFSSFTGQWQTKRCIAWIDELGLALFEPDGKQSTNRKRGMFQMGLRGGYLYPMFIALSFVNPFALAIGTLSFSQGLCYGLMKYAPGRYAVMFAEILYGAVIGVMIYCVL